MTNCTMSVVVSAHMPPNTEYATITALLRRMDCVRGMPTITSMTAPTAIVPVTTIIRSYAAMTIPPAIRDDAL